MHTDEKGAGHKETSEVGNFHASPATIISFQHKAQEDECTQGGLLETALLFLPDWVPKIHYLFLKKNKYQKLIIKL